MNLEPLDGNTFLDLDAIMFVRFDGVDEDETAILKFRNGEAETLTGESARQLHNRLSHREDGSGPLTEPAPTFTPEGSGPTIKASSPTSIHLRTLVVQNSSVLLGRNKAWFHRTSEDGRALILAFVNAKGSCSVRTFEADRGTNLGKHYRSGNYQEQFADLLDGATELTVDSQPNLERDCKQRLPERLLAYLRKQIENTGMKE